MKAATAAVQNLLATNSFVIAELYTLTLAGGGILRYTNADIDIAWSGNSWTSQGPRIQRDKVHMKLGLDVDTLRLSIAPQPPTGSGADLIGGQAWLAAARAGALDGAIVELDFALLPNWQSPVTGTVVWFLGRVAEVEAGRTLAVVTVNSHLELLTAPFPRNLYQPSCRHTLFDVGCTLGAASFAVNASVMAGSTQTVLNASIASVPSGVQALLNGGYPAFQLGRVVFTGGQNSGYSRSVGSYVPSSGPGVPHLLTLTAPLPFPVAAGDAFTAYPGCDKQIATCTLFANLVNYGGFPFIPVPETAV
jgi:uncharacterized phage protein (TIGR02218 family)